MKRIFRSIINIKKSGVPTISPDDLKRNYRAFLASRVDPEDNSYIKIYHWIEAHFRDEDDIPAIELLFERSQTDGDEETLAALKAVAGELPYSGSDYRQVLKEKFEEQSKDKFQTMLTNTWKVVASGLKIGKGKKEKEIKGIPNALDYLLTQSRNFHMKMFGVKTEGNIRNDEDSQEVIDAYKKRKADPNSNKGLYTFLDKIDDVTRGIKPGELAIIAAFVGQGKTTWVTNLAYNGILQGLNGLYIPLEMTYEEMKDMMYSIHCGFPDWLEHPKYKNMAGKLSYDKIRYGELSDLEQEFFEVVVKDFGSNPDLGEIFIYQPSDPLTPSSVELKAYDVNAELQERGKQLDFLIVDYCGLMVPDKTDKYGDYNTDLNIIVKRLKNLALQFDNGRMLRVITPFQTNRSGWKEAEKNDGQYKLSALSNANETERSADLIMTAYMTDEMKKAGIVKLGCLKHRRGAIFPTFESKIDFQSKIIRDIIQEKANPEGITDIALDA